MPPLPESLTAARISESVAQLEEHMVRMNPTSYGPTEPHLWLVGKIPPKTWETRMGTSERKSRAHLYDDLVDPLIKLAMERENDSHMDEYLRKHLRRKTPAEKGPGGRPAIFCGPGGHRELFDALSAPQRQCTLSIFFFIIFFFHFLFFRNAEFSALRPYCVYHECVGNLFFTI